MMNQPHFYPHSMQKDPKCELYVSNLEEEINEQILYNLFSGYGHVVGVKIMRHLMNRKSRGFAFITYKNQASAQKALKDMNGKQIFRNKIQVYSKEKYQSIDKNSNVFFSKLPKSLTRDKFEEMVAEIGDIFSIKFNELEDDEYNTAYVQYEKNGDAENAIGILNNKEVDGVEIQVATTSKNNIVFIRGKNSSTVVQEIQELTQPYGEVIFSEKLENQTKTEFIISLRFSSEKKAKQFIQENESKKTENGTIKSIVGWERRKEVYHKFKKHQGVLYFKIFPIKEEVTLP